jgi:cytosine/uracil/thiamine/allantoin permease
VKSQQFAEELAPDPRIYIAPTEPGQRTGLLGPTAGMMVTDYFLVRRRRLDTCSLYRRGCMYEYKNGFNSAALNALAAGSSPRWSGGLFRRSRYATTMLDSSASFSPVRYSTC